MTTNSCSCVLPRESHAFPAPALDNLGRSGNISFTTIHNMTELNLRAQIFCEFSETRTCPALVSIACLGLEFASSFLAFLALGYVYMICIYIYVCVSILVFFVMLTTHIDFLHFDRNMISPSPAMHFSLNQVTTRTNFGPTDQFTGKRAFGSPQQLLQSLGNKGTCFAVVECVDGAFLATLQNYELLVCFCTLYQRLGDFL